ncbi:MAG: N-acetyltransferase family protein [Intestinibacter sp.]|uniref:GNAT family N-acetyltransferase n=1 Tax=Intestinibacter sp. TaxID=1965304 RepID=UPI0025B89C47|nr:GNAT family N-acetyltransferase [Intestinibacter sp.]MCI6738674.1 N-acetyltransferase family protein [Intestinibacter sp.]
MCYILIIKFSFWRDLEVINMTDKKQVLENLGFRRAKLSDAERLLEIYSPYVIETAITFEYDVPSVEEFRGRIEDISSEYPYIVCTYKDEIIGYAYAHRHMERAAYQWNAELSIYLDMDYKSLGVGKILYGKLIEILKLQNVENVYGCITTENEKSVKFHEKLGFKFIGIYPDTGYKFGRWYDITWLGMRIADKNQAPKPLKAIYEVDQDAIEDILNF